MYLVSSVWTVCVLLASEVRWRCARGCMVLLDSDVHSDDHGDGRHEGGTPAGSSGGRRWEVPGASDPIRSDPIRSDPFR